MENIPAVARSDDDAVAREHVDVRAIVLQVVEANGVIIILILLIIPYLPLTARIRPYCYRVVRPQLVVSVVVADSGAVVVVICQADALYVLEVCHICVLSVVCLEAHPFETVLCQVDRY